MPFSLIVAATPSGVIGLDGGMPWRLSTDLRRFKRLTMGHIIIMGRKTFDSIGRALPGRTTFVLTRDEDWSHPDVDRFLDLESLVEAVGDQQAFVVGGAEIYQALFSRCDRVYLTRVLEEIPGDTRVNLDLSQWDCRHTEHIGTSDRDSVETEFTIWERIAR